MKIKFFNLASLNGRWRGVVILMAAVLLLSFGPGSGVAQVKTPKLITSLQLGNAAEGALVIIVSESVLNEYEAIRRGDRFYVTIPSADFTFAAPPFQGDGFDDVQVQEVGNSVVVSFKLQPGASAWVNQVANRLQVIFSSPNRIARRNSQNISPSAASVGLDRLEHAQTSQGRNFNTAGPMPLGSPQAGRERRVTESANPWPAIVDQQSYRARDSRNSANNHVAIASGTPEQAVPSPTVNNGAASSSYPAVTSDTPLSFATPKPALSPSALGSSPNWKTGMNVSLQWVSANRLTTVITALVLLNLVLFIISFVYRRRKNAGRVERAKAPFAQPKTLGNLGTDDAFPARLVRSKVPTNLSRESRNDFAASGRANERPSPPASTAANSSADPGLRGRHKLAGEPAMATSGLTVPPNHAVVLTKPTISSPERSNKEVQEREVFEL